MRSHQSSARLSSNESHGEAPSWRSGQPQHGPLRLARLLVSTLGGLALLWSLLGSVSGLGGPQPASAASDPVIAAAGDIACDPGSSKYHSGQGTSTECHQKYTSDLLVNAGLAAVLDLGDVQYYCGGLAAFEQSYDPTWGRVKAITHPAVGNHEYLTSGGTGCDSSNANAAGYFAYFGSAAGTPGQGYYSYDIGSWHLIALNSNCGDAGGCNSGSPQYNWLQADLASHQNYCTLAYWHIPLFSSGGRASPNSRAFWNLLYQYDADVVLAGHDHIYERFAPQTPTGVLDTARGLRQFTVGTGGNNHTTITTVAANSEVLEANTFGVLKLTLHATSYDWQFVPEAGKTFSDSGTGNCHGSAPAPTATPTTAPLPTSTGQLTATNTPLPPTPTNTPLPATATPTPGSTQTATFNPEADSYVNSSSAGSNYGTLTALRVDGSPIVNSYLRFNVTALNGAAITRARLLLYMNSGSSAGLQARGVADNTWAETAITYDNAPPLGSALASSGAVSTGTWSTLDVTGYVTGEGLYSFGIITTGSTAISFASRESGANAPQLILDLAGGGTPAPTATDTPPPTPTDTGLPPTPTDTGLPPTPTDTGLPPTPTDTPLPATATPTPGSTQTAAFNPEADSYVNSSSAGSNYGTLTALRVDGSPIVNSYLRFNVTALNGAAITRARLLLYMNSGSSAGLQARGVADNTWAETAITYDNAPPLGSALASSGAVSTGTWSTLDVTGYVTGEGLYSFGIITTGSTAISFASRESGANAPQLILDLVP